MKDFNFKYKYSKQPYFLKIPAKNKKEAQNILRNMVWDIYDWIIPRKKIN